MIEVRNKWRLSRVEPTDEFVYIRTTKQIFRYHGGWIEKKYFSVEECTRILDLNRTEVWSLIKTLGIDSLRGRVHRITLKQLTKLIDNKGLLKIKKHGMAGKITVSHYAFGHNQ